MDKVLKDDKGRFLTMALFYETNTNPEKFAPVYTLRKEEFKGLPSAYQIYMSAVDEYAAALELVGDFNAWQKLCGTKWFMDGKNVSETGFDGLNAWRAEKLLKEDSELKRKLLALAAEGNVQAIKTLHKPLHETRGRPSKKEINQQTKQFVDSKEKINSLYDRFKVVNKDK